MASEMLVRAQEPHKGAVVAVRPAGWQWGGEEQLPKFAQVTVTDGLYSDARVLADPWVRNVTMTVDASTALSATVTFSAAPVRASDNAGGVTAASLQSLIDAWAMVVQDDSPNAVQCSVAIFAASISQGFWNMDISAAAFTDLGVVDGWQRIRMDYSTTGWDRNQVGAQIARRFGEVSLNDGIVVEFGMAVLTVRDALLNDLGEYREQVAKRRYRIAPAAVDAIIDNGGTFTATEQQVRDNLQDLTAL